MTYFMQFFFFDFYRFPVFKHFTLGKIASLIFSVLRTEDLNYYWNTI